MAIAPARGSSPNSNSTSCATAERRELVTGRSRDRCVLPQLVCGEASVARRADEWEAVGERGEVDGLTCDCQHLLLGRRPEYQERDERSPRLRGELTQQLLLEELSVDARRGHERQPHECGPAAEILCRSRITTEQLACGGNFSRREGEIVRVERGETSRSLEPGQWDVRKATARQQQVPVVGQAAKQPAEHLFARRTVGDHVAVVEDDAHVERRSGDDRPHDVVVRSDVLVPCGFERTEDRNGELLGVLVTLPARHPCIDAQRRDHVQPRRLRDRRGLSEAGAGDDGSHRQRETTLHPFDQRRSDELRGNGLGNRARRDATGDARAVSHRDQCRNARMGRAARKRRNVS
jgi:hypothetical protein